jgi:alpha/beta superfamily hydrolase
MSDPNRLPGARDVRTTLDGPGGGAVVVACPPHPEFGGDRHDSRLRAVSDALGDRGVDCLRIDYGAWDGGRGERTDALTALSWAGDEYDRVGLFGYSFGGAVALSAAIAAEGDERPAAVSALAPAADSVDGFDPAELGRIGFPGQVVYGERDDTAAWQPVVETARELGWVVEAMPADHFFVSQQGRVGDLIGEFLAGTVT